MSQPLQSLSGLVDFECAARWGSFRLAAVELHKTPSAVSQQVKQLEQSLGFQLFVRHPRHISLTEKGHELSSTVGRLLKELQAKVGALRDGEETVLRVSATHSFAMKWLIPRLHRFTRVHPTLDLRVESNDGLASLDDGSCDVALRYSRIARGEETDLLFREQLVVVHSPGLAATSRKGRGGSSLRMLLRSPLLYEGTPELWLRLLEANGIEAGDRDFSRSYSHAGLLVQAAVAGLGVALVPYSLACEDLAQGRLMLASCRPVDSNHGYRLLPGSGRREAPKVKHFAAWMVAEVAEMTRAFREVFPSPGE